MVSQNSCFWISFNDLFVGLFSLVFEEELAKIIDVCPYFLERVVVLILRLSERMFHSHHHFNSSTTQVYAESDLDELLWSSIRFLRLLPSNIMKQLGSHVAVGIWQLLK